MSVLTTQQFTDWLNDPSAIRGTLIEVDPIVAGTPTTRYLSTINYTTSPADSPANIYYDSIVIGGLKYTEKLNYGPSTSAGLSVGDIELSNPNGEITSWLDDIWTNRRIKVYIGDPRWPRDSFVVIFDGVVAGIDTRNRGSINIKIRDKLQRLNTPIFELKYSDVAPYPDSSNVTPYTDPTDPVDIVPEVFLPVIFGEVHNITPIMIDTGNLVYMVNYGNTKGIIEVRDNGVPLEANAWTFDSTKGTIKMLFQPSGTLTCSVQGDNVSQSWDTFASGITYRQTAGSIIRRMVTGYGKTIPDPVTGTPTAIPSPDRFIDGTDIDSANFSAFEASNQQPIGFFSVSRENLLSSCQDIANSIGAQIYMSRQGKLRIIKIVSPPIGTPRIIDELADMMAGSLQISDRTTIVGSVKLGFTKNWTVETSLLTNIPYDHKQLFAEEYSTVIKADYNTINANNFTTYPPQENTYQITQPGAYAEADRRLSLFKIPHSVYSFTGFAPLFDLQLGDTVQILSNVYKMDGSAGIGLGTVVSLQPDWTNGKIQVGVFI